MATSTAFQRGGARRRQNLDPTITTQPCPEPRHRERVLTWPLALFLALVGVILGVAAFRRLPAASVAAALAALRDGDLERDERLAVVRRILALGADAADRESRLAAIMATVALEDREAYDRLTAGAAPPVSAADAVFLDTAALGDPVLTALMAAMLAEVAGDRPSAGRRYAQVVASARLFDMDLAGRLAAAGAARVR